jgi:hypothetical protein
MHDTHKGEQEDSVDLVRGIIQHFVAQAQAGKLRKFNKPNPNFGNDLADIKALVLAEFGWNDQDVVTYEEVLKNWNNNKKIGEPPAPPPKMSVSSVMSSSIKTVSNNGNKSGSAESKTLSDSQSAGGGRDWDGELAELLKSNPNVDWSSLGFKVDEDGIWLKRDSGVESTISTSDKVQILKGETTVDDLRKEN